MFRRESIIALVLGLLVTGYLPAENLSIDFEGNINDLDLYYINGWKTKSPSITASTSVPTGSTGTQSVSFTWASDGPNTNMYAYMVKDLDGTYDFREAVMSYWHRRTNRTTQVGIALFDNGQLAARWEIPMSTTWAQATVDVTTAPPSATGAGNLYSVDAVAFMHRNSGTPGSGLNHTVLFDDFVATGLTTFDPGALAVLAPNGGETLLSGDNVTIAWSNPTPPDPNTPAIADIDIDYSIDNGATWTAVTPANVGNDGSYQWTVPYLAPRQLYPQCLVRVSDATATYPSDISDAVFTIDSECQTLLPGDLNHDCYVNLGDFAIQAENWLECNNEFDPQCAQ